MFPLPYEPPLNWLLYGLFGLELALLIGGLVLGKLNEEGTGRLPRPLRVVLSALLVAAALLGWLGGMRTAVVQGFALWILLGMAAGHIGDLIMAKLIPVPERVVFGMIAFGVGHLLYTAAFLRLALQSGCADPAVLFVVMGAMFVVCSWAWYTYVRQPARSKVLNVGSLVYGWLIGIMVALTLVLAACDAHYLALAVGALLFLVSDFLLGNWVIRGHVWRSVNDAIWLTYVSGQLLIVYSVAAALNVALK